MGGPVPHPVAAQGDLSIPLNQKYLNGGIRWRDPWCSQHHRPQGQGKGRRALCHRHPAAPGGKGTPCVSLSSTAPSTGAAHSPSSPSRPISIAANKRRKLDVTAWPSPAVPEAGTSQSLCWGQRCPAWDHGCPCVPLGAPGCRGACSSTRILCGAHEEEQREKGN